MMPIHFFLLAFLTCMPFVLAIHKAHPWKTVGFYPNYGPFFHDLIVGNCSSQYEHYMTHTGVANCRSCAIKPLTDCLLDNTGETDKADMSGAAVLLGLLPTVLSLAGATTIETGLLAFRRPLLALLLGAGSTAVSPSRTSEYRDPVELLQVRKAGKGVRNIGTTRERLIVALEYIFAAAAVANNTITSLELGIKTMCSVTPNTAFTPILFAFFAIPIHIFGTATVMLRAKLIEQDEFKAVDQRGSLWLRLRPILSRRVKEEFRLCSSHPRATLKTRQETNVFLFISWFTSTGIILHIIYGTLILSATVFISTRDALGVVGRFLASTLVCRAILTYEMRGVRQQITGSDDEVSPATTHESLEYTAIDKH